MKYFVTFDKALKLTGYSVYVQTMMLPGDTVNSTNHVSDLGPVYMEVGDPR